MAGKYLYNTDLLLAAEGLAEALSAATGKTWRQTQDREPWVVDGPDHIRILVAQAWNARGRLTFQLADEQGNGITEMTDWQPDGTGRKLTTSITVDPDRDAAQQSREVQRRLLPDAARISARKRAAYQRQRDTAAALRAVASDLTARCEPAGIVNNDAGTIQPAFVWSLGPEFNDPRAAVQVRETGRDGRLVVHMQLDYLTQPMAWAVVTALRDAALAETAALAERMAAASWQPDPVAAVLAGAVAGA